MRSQRCQQASHLENYGLFVERQRNGALGKPVGILKRLHRSYRARGPRLIGNADRDIAQKGFISGLRRFSRQAFGQPMADFVRWVALFDDILNRGFDFVEIKICICLLYTSPSPRD